MHEPLKAEAACFSVFFLEYYVIRIRSGLAISAFCFGIFCLVSSRKTSKLFFLLFTVSAFLIHLQAALVLVMFFYIPLAWHIISNRSRLSYEFYLIGVIALTLIFLLLIQNSFSMRGEHLFSPLNSFRLFALGIVPLIMYIFGMSEGKFRDKSKKLSMLQSFPKTFVDLYLVTCLFLVIFYIFGLTANSGEALVRVYTLASVPAIFSVFSSGNLLSTPVSSYIVVSNALFQFASLFLR